MTFWVAGNIAASNVVGSGDVASFAVTAINTASTVSGSLPIVGASNTMNSSLTIGTATIQTSSFDPNTAGTQPIGTTGYRFTGIRIQAGSVEDTTLQINHVVSVRLGFWPPECRDHRQWHQLSDGA